MFFASDNWSGAADEVMQSLTRHASGFAPAYGTSDLDLSLERRFNELFEREVAVFFVGTGTAANSLALSAVNRPGGFVLCHRESHLIQDEAGAPEFFTSGARLSPLDGPLGKINPAELARVLDRFDPTFVHRGQPMAVSLTQSTEVGSLYSLDEIAELASLAKNAGLPVHMDGARFANALVSLGVSPADMTWKAGVDVLSFGGTKNGCWCAEAVVFFDPARAKQLPYIRKRAAQLFSKTRFIAAQFHAYLDDDLWLRLATHANTMAAHLEAGIVDRPNMQLAWPRQANELFVQMAKSEAKRLSDAGVKFYAWPIPADYEGRLPDGYGLYRFVTSFATTQAEIDQLVGLIES
ncbi:threonine aldolase family protein [Neorhodopirellula pilleata]|uniref:L-threonine aldolase n=1 Tax=Neorhodopirellula pilleata TaxID=2714738 RepID=A0A5C6AW35_9BACT|nr:low specificity L-threonine aldolase [Neorhodopirellula pilleata]TWU03717.1 Low specificity L-threonine aldolase [Neorhodopirellula pilleata]